MFMSAVLSGKIGLQTTHPADARGQLFLRGLKFFGRPCKHTDQPASPLYAAVCHPGEKMATEKKPAEPVLDAGVGAHVETIEERVFSAALICLEGHFTHSPPMGPKTAARVTSMISKTLEKTHTLRRAR